MVIADGGVPSETAAARFIGRIPVRNIWLLMLYASDLFRKAGPTRVDVECNPDEIADLVAELLAQAVEERQRRQLSLGYRPRSADLSRVRGRIDVLRTEPPTVARARSRGVPLRRAQRRHTAQPLRPRCARGRGADLPPKTRSI